MTRPSLFDKFNNDDPQFREGFQYAPHALSHAPKHRTYTFPLSMGAKTGTAYWCPQYSGQMTSMRLGLASGDPAANASGTVFDLLLNDISVFASAAERPTIVTGTTHSPVVVITRGIWVSGDSWALQCISTGAATGTVTISFEYIGQD